MMPTILVLIIDYLFIAATAEGGIDAAMEALTTEGITMSLLYQVISTVCQLSRLPLTKDPFGKEITDILADGTKSLDFRSWSSNKYLMLARAIALIHIHRVIAKYGVVDKALPEKVVTSSFLMLLLSPGGLLDAGSGKMKDEDVLNLDGMTIPEDEIFQALTRGNDIKDLRFEAAGALKNLDTTFSRILYCYTSYLQAMHAKDPSVFEMLQMLTYDRNRDGMSANETHEIDRTIEDRTITDDDGNELELTFNGNGKVKVSKKLQESPKANCFIPTQYSFMSVMAKLILTEDDVEEGFTTTVEFALKNIKVVNKETGEVVAGGSPSSSRKRKTAPSPAPSATKVKQWEAKVSEYESMSKNMDLRKETRDVAADAATTITDMMKGHVLGLGTQGTPAQGAPSSNNEAVSAPSTAVDSSPTAKNDDQEEEASPQIPTSIRSSRNDVAAEFDQEAEADQAVEDDNAAKKRPARIPRKKCPAKKRTPRRKAKKR